MQSFIRGLDRTWAIPVLLLLVTVASVLYTKDSVDRSAQQEFIFQCVEVRDKIAERLAGHARMLRSGAAFFQASETEVTRQAWQRFATALQLDQMLPGIQGIGFSLMIPKEQLAGHIQEVRSEGFPDYDVKPVGPRDVYSSIVYLEPFFGRNLRAFGYDMLSEPRRRAAMEWARDYDTVGLSDKVVLVQETSVEIQSGALMYVPVYRTNMPTSNVEQRRAAIRGWVYSPFRMNDLMTGILDESHLKEDDLPLFQVFDGVHPSAEGLMYQHGLPLDDQAEGSSCFSRQVPVEFNGKKWTLLFTGECSSILSGQYAGSWLAMAIGIVITLLVSATFRSLLASRKAQRISEGLSTELQNSEERYSLTLAAVNDGLWDWHVPSGSAYLSPVYYALLGYGNAEFPANYSSWRGLVHPEDIDEVERALQASVEAGEGFNIDLRMRMKAGEWLWVSTRGRSVSKGPDGKSLRMVGTLSDISARKSTEELLRTGEELLKQKNRELERFSYTVSHDLRSPLVTIQSFIGMIRKDIEDGNITRALVDMARVSVAATKMNALLHDLLELARVGILINQPSQIDMNLVVKDTLAQLAGAIHKGRLDVVVQPDLPAVFADEKRIAEVVQNLVENAIKYRGDQQTPRIEIGWRHDGNGVIFVVGDNGIGIDPRFQGRIFGLFNKLDPNSEGTGVGLALVKRIVEIHNGRVWVESEGQGKGCRFCFTVGQTA
jgi:PAS domain S-box-containing protein